MNIVTPEKRILLLRAFRASLGSRPAAELAGVSRQTAHRYFKLWAKRWPLCRCGKPRTHRGWCSVRIAHSHERQEFLRKTVRGGKIKPETEARWNTIAEETVEMIYGPD